MRVYILLSFAQACWMGHGTFKVSMYQLPVVPVWRAAAQLHKEAAKSI